MMNIFFETIGRLFFILPSKPKTVQIEVTNLCNLNCKMCPRRFLNVEEKHMDFELFEKIVNRLKGVSEIILTGWGEPLLHPQITEMINYCSNSGFKTRITTNGILLDEGMAQKIIKAGLNILTLSIESLNASQNWYGHLGELQIENIKNFAKKEKDQKLFSKPFFIKIKKKIFLK